MTWRASAACSPLSILCFRWHRDRTSCVTIRRSRDPSSTSWSGGVESSSATTSRRRCATGPICVADQRGDDRHARRSSRHRHRRARARLTRQAGRLRGAADPRLDGAMARREDQRRAGDGAARGVAGGAHPGRSAARDAGARRLQARQRHARRAVSPIGWSRCSTGR